jgi:hypothetical protein
MGGAHTIPLTAGFARQILKHLTKLPPRSTVLLRKPMHEDPNPIESLIGDLSPTLGIAVEWYSPEPGGRTATFLRDVKMIERSDVLIVYFHPEHVMEEGTGHLVEKATDRDMPVWAYTWSEEHGLEWVGEGGEPPPHSPAHELSRVM